MKAAPVHVRAGGFTLLELLVVLAIVAIVLVMALPAFRDAINNQKLKNAIGDIQLSLVYARSEAIKRNADVDVIPNTVGSWNQGWQVKFGATSIRTLEAYPALTINLTDATGAVGPTKVTYARDGRTTAANFGAWVTNNTTLPMRCVRINLGTLPAAIIDSHKLTPVASNYGGLCQP